MACKIITKKGSIIDKTASKKASIAAYAEYSSGIIDTSLDSVDNLPQTEVRKLKKERKSENIKEETFSGIYAIGKRLFMIEKSSFGPKLSERNNLVDTSFSGKEDVDSFRIVYGSYWTKTEDNKSLTHIHKPKGVNFSIDDYNFASVGGIKLEDRGDENTLSTRQWVLISANESFFNKSSFKNVNYGQLIEESFNRIRSSDTGLRQQTRLNNYKNTIWKKWLEGGEAAIGLGSVILGIGGQTITFDGVIKKNVDYYDHTYELPTPFSHKEIQGVSLVNKPSVARIEPTYNFLIEKYENTIDPIPEHLLPNLYSMYLETEVGIENDEMLKHITVDGRIPFTEITVKNPSRRREKDLVKIGGQYFNKYSRAYESIINEDKGYYHFSNFGKRFKNLVVSSKNLKIINNAYDKRFLFPMFIDFQFSTDPTAAFTQVIQDAKIGVSIFDSVVEDTQFGVSIPRMKFLEATEVLSQRYTDLGSLQTKKTMLFNNSERRVWDLTELIDEFMENRRNQLPVYKPIKTKRWWNRTSRNDRYLQYLSSLTAELEEQQRKEKVAPIYLGEVDDETKAATDPTYRFYTSILKLIFTGKIRKLIKDKFRTFQELIEGKPAYSETIFYRIEKHLANENGKPKGNSLQNFYLPNINQDDLLRFVDTQVKYGERYVYNIYAYQAVIGTKYRYEDVRVRSGVSAAVLVVQEPSVRLVETPYFSYTGMINDSPPCAPDVNVIPYRGEKNKILFFLNANTGQYILDPVSIESEDDKIFARIRKNNDLEDNDPILFKTDDHTGLFQIFRSEEKPESWRDFSGKMIAEIETDVSKISLQKATAAAFVDNIEENKKYYYVFRVKDYHNKISNPSPIYEIKLVAERNTVYPEIKTVEFSEGLQKKSTRQLKRYIKIAPALGQTIINKEKSGLDKKKSAKDVEKVMLGIKDESMWGTQFKIRLVSKQSGKKIDFNVKFDNKNVRISREEEKGEQQ